MFMNESAFEEKSNIDVKGDFGTAGHLTGGAASRAKILQQQRDLQKKKLQSRMGGTSIRSSGAKDFSSPRAKNLDDEPSFFGSEERVNPVSPGGSRYRDRSRQSSRTEELEDRSLNSRRSKSRNYDEEEKEDYGRKSRSRKKRMEEEIEDLDLSDEDHVRSSRKDRKKHSRNIRDSSDEDISEDEMEEDSKSLRLDKVKNRPLDLSDMRKFLTTPHRGEHAIECYIERNKSGSNRMFPEYCLYLKDGDRFLLTAKKRAKNKTSNYLISMQRGDLNRNSNNYLGKLRANFMGTEFLVYDDGEKPADLKKSKSDKAARQELACVVYNSNLMNSGPRKMRVCAPRVRDDGTRTIWRPKTKHDEMITKCKEQDHTNLHYLINKPPRWNEEVGAYVLNFNGRVTQASVKNFQLVQPEDQETVVLQFGRTGTDIFSMDLRGPLCPLQAFAVTLSSFDSKLACD